MSMILDALKRADRERHRQEASPPSLATDHAAPPHRRPSHRRTWLLAGALLLTGAAIGLTLAGVKSTPEPTPEPSSQTVPDQASPDQTPLGQGNSTSEDLEATPKANGNNDPAPTSVDPAETELSPTAIARLYQKDRTPQEAPEPAVAQLYQDPQPAATPVEEKVQHQPEPDPEPQTVSVAPPRPSEPVRIADTSAPTDSEPSVTEENTRKPSERETEPAGGQSKPAVPGIRDLPWSLQKDIPSLNYQAHNYEEGNNSSVTINQRQRRAGDEVARGVRIERIESDGLVLTYEGKTFKLKAMNSWVNM